MRGAMLEIGNVVVTMREIEVGLIKLEAGVTGQVTGIVPGGGAMVLFGGQKEPWIVEEGLDKDVVHYKVAEKLYEEVVV
ncbi:MAG: hypothetical protein HOA57_03760 [Candidatus Magasanikbacteria bacterium]|nr:hypothetical protein [Candidatus Magasanikbacteria bacterium]MBT6819464.1 hypothetical protein [Candidatus Magasanikbacteria bacterium]